MNWKGFLSRITLVAVAFPLLGSMVFLLPQRSHLAFNAVVVGTTLVGAFEVEALFRSRKIRTSRYLSPLLAGTLPAVAYLETAGIIPALWQGIWAPVALGIILVRSVLFQGARRLPNILTFASSSFFVFLYPGWFMAWIVRLSSLSKPSLSIVLFLCMVFGNDMAAYFAGSLWGRSTRLMLPVSPQKSAVGFAAGLAGSLIVVFLFVLLVPGFPPFRIVIDIVFALAMGVAVILGDLLESGLKRSAGVKDSGIVIPGRGGMLDSVDSMLLSAPFFYYFFTLVGR